MVSNTKKLRVAVLAPIHWRTPPEKYGPWELVASMITEELVRRGHEVTLFATGDSLTKAKLRSICPHPLSSATGKTLEPKVYEYLHSALPFENASEFDIIHNHYNVYPLVFSQLVATPVITTMHGFSSPGVVEVMKKYTNTYFVSISMADRNHAPDISWLANVYSGVELEKFTFQSQPDDYLLFFGRIDHEKGTREAIEVARQSGRRLLIAGLISNEKYYREEVEPALDGKQIIYVGNVGPAQRDVLLGKAVALLHMINFDEPFGLSVIEAMACGTPVIAMNRGSMPELIIDGQTGFLINSVDQAVATTNKLDNIDRQACRRHIEANFTVERMIDGYLEAYQRVLQ